MNNSSDPYKGRKQTEAKHFILRSYLYALAFKVLSTWDELTYVDGFSGPWNSNTKDFSDTSFMIAIEVLKDVQKYYLDRDKKKTIKCFFVEKNPKLFAQLELTVAAHDSPTNRFHIATFCGPFEDAIEDIVNFIGTSFALVFIDPTGWTGFEFGKISAVLNRPSEEVLINVMYDHYNRFINTEHPEIEASFAPILGGPNWRARLDPEIPRGRAVLKLFREELKKAGAFTYVTTTQIDKATADRPHYFLAYGTRSEKGLKAFRQVEWDVLRAYETNRRAVKLDRSAERSGQRHLFSATDLPDDSTVEALVVENKMKAKIALTKRLRRQPRPVKFGALWPTVLEAYMLRETDVKDICVELAKERVIEATWTADGKRKPHDYHVILFRGGNP